MKKWMRILAGVLAMSLMAACHPDEKDKGNGPVGPGMNEKEDPAYMAVQISLPGGRAAKAGSGNIVGTEVGQEYENRVSNMLIVLAKAEDDSFITYGEVVNPAGAGANGNLTAVSSMNRSGLTRYYNVADGATVSGKIHVYVFCNYTAELLAVVTEAGRASEAAETGAESRESRNWIHAVGHLAGQDEGIMTRGAILMSNAAIAERQLPTSVEVLNRYVNDPTHPFQLCGDNSGDGGVNNGQDGQPNPIKVQRAVARFDFKQLHDNTYTIVTKGIGSGDLQVELVRMGLVNLNRQFYFLKRVAAADASVANMKANAVICGAETGVGADASARNYVLDADAEAQYKTANGSGAKITLDKAYQDAYRHLLFNLSGQVTDNERIYWKNVRIETLADSTASNGDDQYKIWTYVTENTIPHAEARVGVATGIVFKGQLLATEGTNDALKAAVAGKYGQGEDASFLADKYVTKLPQRDAQGQVIAGGDTLVFPILYAFGTPDRTLYVGWNDQVKQAMDNRSSYYNATLAAAAATPNVADESGAELSPDAWYQKLIAASEEQKDAVLSKFKQSATKAGFTLYQASDDAVGMSEGSAAEPAVKSGETRGYYCYYYYWNKHNVDDLEGTMSPMEYAVVRNNVYRISVTGIRYFGHPRITANDPDPLTPDSPCEKNDLYMSVNVEVADWTVRENNIVL